jgi:hypothetical protein
MSETIEGSDMTDELREGLPVSAESGGRIWSVCGEGDPVEGWLFPLSEEDLANGVETPPHLGCSTITETTHATPTGDDGLTPCCGRTPLELPRTDRLTLEEALVTCFTITDRQVEAADEWMRGFLWRHFGMGTTGRFGREMLEAARVVHREET